MPRATIRAVAEAAGVSKSTVSFVINNTHPQVDRIPVETRERIKACAAALGYRGSPVAAALRTRKPLWIGVVSDILPANPANWAWAPFFEMSLLSGAQRRLAEHGYFTLLGLRHVEDEAQARDIDLLASAEIGGLILKAGSDMAVKKGEALLAAGIPVVNVFPLERSDLYPYVVDLDNVAAGRLAAELAIQGGAKNPAYITKDKHMLHDRARGLIEKFQDELGVSLAVCRMPEFPGDVKANDAAAARLIADFLRKERPDAVIALEAGLSIQLSRAADDLSLDIPKDLTIIGFDCIVNRTSHQQRISSIGVSWMNAGETAAEIILDNIDGIKPDGLPRLLAPIFIPGATTPPGVSHESAEPYVRGLAQFAI